MKITTDNLKVVLISICIVFIFGDFGHAIEIKRFPQGFAFELGAGYDQLYSKYSGESYNRRAFSISPTIRLLYTANLEHSLSLIPFAGYNRLGGRSAEGPGGFRDECWWDCIELGSFVNYKPKRFEFGIGLKANLTVRTVGRHHYGLTSPVDAEGNWSEEYYANEFDIGSFDGGVRLGWGKKRLYSVIEAWFGFGNLAKGTMFDDSDAKARENHFRLLLGYRL